MRTSALNAVFDLLLVFGLDILTPKEDAGDNKQADETEVALETEQSDSEEKPDEEIITETSALNSILKMFSDFLDSEV